MHTGIKGVQEMKKDLTNIKFIKNNYCFTNLFNPQASFSYYYKL